MQEHYFDKETRVGFIEYRIANCRMILPISEKRYQSHNKISTPISKGKSMLDNPTSSLSEEELKEKVYYINLYWTFH